MGKRELVLAVAFVVLGFVVYQVTAPPADASRPGWSFAGILEQVRREVRGNQAAAEAKEQETIPASAALREIRIVRHPREVTVIGEDRADVEIQLHVNSRAYDEAEAQRTADATRLLTDEAGEVLMLTMSYPPEGRQTASLILKVPKRLALRVDEKGGKLTASNLASVTIGAGRGQTILRDISGPVQASQRGSAITLVNVGALRLTTVSAEVKLTGVQGNATLNLQGGEARAEGIAGAIELEMRNAEVKLDGLANTRGPIRINAIGGELALTGLRTEARIDGRRTEVRIDQPSAAPLSIYSEGDETVEVTVPSNGFTVDAVAVNGRISLDDALQQASLTVHVPPADPDRNERRESRVSGEVRGGGPTLTLRASRGHIVLRAR